MNCITLASSYREKCEPEKLCGGDIHRALAPKVLDEPTVNNIEDIVRKRTYTKNTNPRKIVVWDDESVELLIYLYPLVSKSQLAMRLNKSFPQDNGTLFTKNSVAGKYYRVIRHV